MNIENFICHKIQITQAYENGILGGPKDLSFVTNDIEINIKQIGVRMIELSYVQTGDFYRLYSTFCQLEKLFVLFEGEFLAFKKIIAYDCHGKEIEQSQLFDKIKSSRLYYCSTIDACRGNTTLNVPRSLLTISVVRASPSISSAMIKSFCPPCTICSRSGRIS